MQGLKVLSCFDGMACGLEALKRAGIPVLEYFASEIDPYTIKIAKKNHPEILHIGSIENWRDWGFPIGYFDLIIGGSPCQGFSGAGKGLNFEDPRSKLYFEYEALLKEYKPKWWLLENVKMKKEWSAVITERLGVQPVLINSALVSAQNRERLYWANFPIGQPQDRGILLRDIILEDVWPVVVDTCRANAEEYPRVYENKSSTLITPTGGNRIQSFVIRYNRKDGIKDALDKSLPLCASDWRGINRNQNQNAIIILQKPRGNNAGGVRAIKGKTPSLTGSKWEDSNHILLSPKEREYIDREVKDGRTHWDFQHHSDTDNPKSASVVANFFKGVLYNVLINRIKSKCGFWTCDFWDDDSSCENCKECDNYQGSNTVPTSAIRKFHPIECERLQTLQDNYTEGVSNTQRYKMIGNGWTVEVIKHIFQEIVK